MGNEDGAEVLGSLARDPAARPMGSEAGDRAAGSRRRRLAILGATPAICGTVCMLFPGGTVAVLGAVAGSPIVIAGGLGLAAGAGHFWWRHRSGACQHQAGRTQGPHEISAQAPTPRSRGTVCPCCGPRPDGVRASGGKGFG